MMKKYLMILIAAVGMTLTACDNEKIEDSRPTNHGRVTNTYIKVMGHSMSMGGDSLLMPVDGETIDSVLFMNSIGEKGWIFQEGKVVSTKYSPKPEANIQDLDPTPDFCIKGNDLMEFDGFNDSQSIFFLNHNPYTYDATKRAFVIKRERRTETYTILSIDDSKGALVLLRQTKYKYLQGTVFYKVLTYRMMDDGELNEKVKEYGESPFHIAVDGEGNITVPFRLLISPEEFQRQIAGYGWKYLEAHKIYSDGSLEIDEFYHTIVGIGPMQHYFSDTDITNFFDVDAVPAHCNQTFPYSYADNSIQWQSGQLSILSYDEATSTLVLMKSEKNHSLLMFYHRMTDEELAQTREYYNTKY